MLPSLTATITPKTKTVIGTKSSTGISHPFILTKLISKRKVDGLMSASFASLAESQGACNT